MLTSHMQMLVSPGPVGGMDATLLHVADLEQSIEEAIINKVNQFEEGKIIINQANIGAPKSGQTFARPYQK
jgi:hypothetical protein